MTYKRVSAWPDQVDSVLQRLSIEGARIVGVVKHDAELRYPEWGNRGGSDCRYEFFVEQ